MPNQTFTVYTGKSYAGELVDSGPRVTQTGVLTSPTADFGIALKRDTSVDRGVAIGTTNGNVASISLREYNLEASVRPSDGTTVYRETESVSTMQQGFIMLELAGSVAIVAGQVLHVDTVTGVFSKDVVAANVIACTNVVAEEDALVGEVFKARIDRIVG